MISRRTLLFFLVAVIAVGVFEYRTRELFRPCREWKHHHSLSEPAPAPVQQPDGSFTATLNPCNFQPEASVFDRLVALLGFVFAIAFVTSLSQDLIRWVKRRSPRPTLPTT